MRRQIFSTLKRGDGGRVFSSLLSRAERAIKNAKRNPLKDETVKKNIENLEQFLISLRFAIFFLRNDFKSSFEVPNKHIDKFAIPNDLLDKKKAIEIRNFFKHVFSVHYDQLFVEKFKDFSDVEIARLDEAIVTLQCDAYFSCIIMCVSAVEARLHSMVKKSRPRVYNRDNLEKATLGTLLSKISSDRKYSFIRKQLPERYFHFFDFCNKYRIFSAHPKEVAINYQDAISIFALSMAILVDSKYISKISSLKKGLKTK